MSVAIVTTALKPGLGFETWLEYHLKKVKLVLIYMDDHGARSQFQTRYSDDERVQLHEGSQARPDLTPESRTMVRQDANLQNAIDVLLSKGEIDWILHIDLDELLFEADGFKWQEEYASAPSVRFDNHEALPLKTNTQDPFRDCNLFKLNGKGTKFLAYGNGKAAVRLRPGAQPWGPHFFRGFEGEAVKVPKDRAVVLHYPYPSFEWWKQKFVQYGDFSDYWYNDKAAPNKVGFMLKSREVVKEALKTSDWNDAQRFFDDKIPEGEELQKLIGEGRIAEFRPLGNDLPASITG